MNPLAPVSNIMTRLVITVSPNDNLLNVKHIFESHNIHHIPVVDEGKVVGMISKSDYYKVTPGLYYDAASEDNFYERIAVKEVMISKFAKVEPTERIDVVALILSENRFHAVPVVSADNELRGIVTSFDLIRNAYKLTQEAWA